MEINIIDIIDRIKFYTQLKELENIGITQTQISVWKVRGTIPRSDDLYKISKFIGVSMEYLLTGEDTAKNFNTNEKILFEKISKLSPEQQNALRIIIDSMK